MFGLISSTASSSDDKMIRCGCFKCLKMVNGQLKWDIHIYVLGLCDILQGFTHIWPGTHRVNSNGGMMIFF